MLPGVLDAGRYQTSRGTVSNDCRKARERRRCGVPAVKGWRSTPAPGVSLDIALSPISASNWAAALAADSRNMLRRFHGIGSAETRAVKGRVRSRRRLRASPREQPTLAASSWRLVARVGFE